MKTWKLVSGILSLIFFFIVGFQSCAVGFINAVESNKSDTSGGAGVIVAFCILIGGVVSMATRGSKGNGGNVVLIIFFGLAALMGFSNLGTYGDLAVWSGWSLLCAVLAVVSFIKNKRAKKNVNASNNGVAVIIAAIAALSLASCGGSSSSEAGSEQAAESKEVIEYVECKASDILKEFEENQARAKKNYEDKYLSVDGVVNRIDDSGEYFELDGGEDFAVQSVKCEANTDELKNQIIDLNKKQQVKVKGKCTNVSGGFRIYTIEVDSIEVVK